MKTIRIILAAFLTLAFSTTAFASIDTNSAFKNPEQLISLKKKSLAKKKQVPTVVLKRKSLKKKKVPSLASMRGGRDVQVASMRGGRDVQVLA